MPELLGADYSDAQHERPDPITRTPKTQLCEHPEGGIVKLYNGVPVVLRKKGSARLGLDDTSKANSVGDLKDYLELEVELAAGDASRRNGALIILEDIRAGCLAWFSRGRSWGLKYKEDVEKGLQAIGMIYPDFENANPPGLSLA
jgi:hypothetical protein